MGKPADVRITGFSPRAKSVHGSLRACWRVACEAHLIVMSMVGAGDMLLIILLLFPITVGIIVMMPRVRHYRPFRIAL